MFEWFHHFLNYVIPEFLVEVFAAIPFVAVVCTVYWFIRRAWHKKRLGADFGEARRKCRLNEIIRLLLVAWITAIFLLCFIPGDFTRNFWGFLANGRWHQRQTPFGFHNRQFAPLPAWVYIYFIYEDYGGMSMGMILDMIFNVILFMPLGVALPIIWRKANLWKTTLVGFVITFLIEVAVQPFIERDPTCDDLLCNTLGALFGYLLFMLLRKIFPKFIESCRQTIKT